MKRKRSASDPQLSDTSDSLPSAKRRIKPEPLGYRRGSDLRADLKRAGDVDTLSSMDNFRRISPTTIREYDPYEAELALALNRVSDIMRKDQSRAQDILATRFAEQNPAFAGGALSELRRSITRSEHLRGGRKLIDMRRAFNAMVGGSIANKLC